LYVKVRCRYAFSILVFKSQKLTKIDFDNQDTTNLYLQDT